MKIKVRIIVEPDGDAFHAYCPELKGVHVSGDSELEALENCCIAIDQHIRTILKYGDPIPIGCMDMDEERGPKSFFKSLARIVAERFRRKEAVHSHIRELSIEEAMGAHL